MAISVFHSGVVWVTDTHTEASLPRSPPHEADTVALEEQLKGTRLTKTGDDNVLQGQPLHQLKYALQSLTDTSRRTSAHLGEHTARGTWSLPEASYTLNIWNQGGLLALKEFQDLCLNLIATIATDNTMVVAYLRGGE